MRAARIEEEFMPSVKPANGKTAIVTGAGTGIGKATAAALLAEGWNTVFVGRRKNLLDEAAAQATSAAGNGAKALGVSCDVTKPAEVDALFAEIDKAFGRVDLLFNNAGMGFKTSTIDEVPVEAWNEVVAVNLTGSFLVARAAFAAMRRQKPMGGRIINNGSISAHTPRPGSVPYTATKHAITGLTKTLALDGRPFDIACGQIDIGNVQTSIAPLSSGMPQADGSMKGEPVMDVQSVAQTVIYMANLPPDANVLFLTVMATKMPFVGRG
jgi:NAD(P)-dependent dehydrogenase (short-subunit alcohol dehydrogenase family)